MFNPIEYEGVGYGGSSMTHDISEATGLADHTPKAVALYLIVAGGTLYLLKSVGFRFNFGIAAGR